MLHDVLVRLFARSEGRVGGDRRAQFTLNITLVFKESIEKQQIFGCDRGAVGMCREQIVGVHGDQQRRI